jgi:hypothetical protein
MFVIDSPSFRHGSAIPPRFTCDGANVSPPLRWRGAPAGTKSIALIVDDPDAPDPAAPKRVWVHWVLYNVLAATSELAEGATRRTLPPDAREGVNDGGHVGYDGPCPPKGRHRYFHKAYALDTVLPDLGARAGKAELERAMSGHVLAHAELVGTYAAK